MSDMKDENARLATYVDWPVSFLEPSQMAANGFYYLRRSDEVRCAFCKVEIMRWLEGDDPAVDHKRWAPQCPFVQQNTAQQNQTPAPVQVVANQDECGSSRVMFGPMHPKYSTESARLKTFVDWPVSLKQKPEQLAEAGFYYTGKGDRVKCFHCDGGLKDWESTDEPWEEHARWFDRCTYVRLVKGYDYVQRVLSKACVIKKEENVEQSAKLNVPEENSDCVEQPLTLPENKMCKICFNAEKTVCFNPCGHVLVCVKCATVLKDCPMCRAKILNPTRIYQV
ncbi:inhibitor of apoptosis protein 3 [Choristoneura fumiferana DEF multiple nucleopolyhedrovirus]|uniref:Inhibitor of apoptosis protein 3 n=1 Tax=Choristoneura fumiferana defective polyhedrosis virus TaxID=74660 RepID=Q6VTV9_NPVCD|nr:inhibitor of apoptosis protein 3 [Choristoneura fumiferana DEF multiple nucleopolyhedrovirus]AAQ91688.1 inhibitor of apoptosis protein 3 [Choristoneura fumiferana DEF multiple nucleopolyhedrovirus]